MSKKISVQIDFGSGSSDGGGVPALERLLTAYQPYDQSEEDAKREMLLALLAASEGALTRDSSDHFAASAFVTDDALTKVLLVQHKVYGALCIPGGHADGDADLLRVALRETAEETGVSATPLVSVPVSLDILPVPAHEKNGRAIAAHHHFVLTFALFADAKRSAATAGAQWHDLQSFLHNVPEAHMQPVYDKCLVRAQSWRTEKRRLMDALPALTLPWYALHARALPWRENADPYRVWVSEIMLQQTRVEAVKEYYLRFMRELPDVYALAACDDERLMKLWEGLGYYSRARNLKRAAQWIVQENGGRFPRDAATLKRLAGVGEYTAGAIASIAFGQRVAAVDGNVLRVLGRYAQHYERISDADYRARLARELARVYPARDAGAFTQSLMELGATVCTPNGAPDCKNCPLGGECLSLKHATTAQLPVRDAKPIRRIECLTVFVLRCADALAVQKRPDSGLLAGLWALPNTVGFLDENAVQQWLRAQGLTACGEIEVLSRKHIFTHLEWHMRVYRMTVKNEAGGFVWATESARKTGVSLPTAFRRCLQ